MSGPLKAFVPQPAAGWKLDRPAMPANSNWRLSSPFWRGEVELKTGDLFSPKRIRIAVAHQKSVFIPESFDRDWLNGRTVVDQAAMRLVSEPGLLEQLLRGVSQPAE